MEHTINPAKVHQSPAKKIVLCGLLLAVGIVLPTALHLTGLPGGPVLLPMHLPVFLAGTLCGGPYGAIVGLVLPGISTLLTGMPALFPMLPLMTVELAVYGLVSGLLYRRYTKNVFVALLAAMVAGRIANALMLVLLGSVLHLAVPPVASAVTSVITGLPGIVAQLILVPAVVRLVKLYDKK